MQSVAKQHQKQSTTTETRFLKQLKHKTSNIMRERAIKTILNLTDKYTKKELESIEDTIELVALSLDIKRILNKSK